MSQNERKGWTLDAASENPKPPALESEPVMAQEVDEIQNMLKDRILHTCPKCSWDIRQNVLKVGEDDLREYTRCILEDVPFKKEIKIYSGMMSIVFQENTDKVRAETIRIMNTLTDPNTSALEAATIARKIQILFTVVEFKMEGRESNKSFTIPEIGVLQTWVEAVALFEERFTLHTGTLITMLSRSYLVFDKLLNAIVEGAFDESFYQGAGLV